MNPSVPLACIAALTPRADAMPVRTAITTLIQKPRFLFFSGRILLILLIF